MIASRLIAGLTLAAVLGAGLPAHAATHGQRATDLNGTSLAINTTPPKKPRMWWGVVGSAAIATLSIVMVGLNLRPHH